MADDIQPEQPPRLVGQMTPNPDTQLQFGFTDATSGDTYRTMDWNHQESSPDYVQTSVARYDAEGRFIDLEQIRFARHPIVASKRFTAEKIEEHPKIAKVAKLGGVVTALTLTATVGSLWVKHRRRH